MARTFVMGDIHGAYKAFVQCLDRSGFDPDNDMLIQLGDVADGWPEVFECVEHLLQIKNLIAIRGNHDAWALDFLNSGKQDMANYHYNQGGKATLQSYAICEHSDLFLHTAFFQSQVLYHKDAAGNVFVHGGFDFAETLERQEPETFLWDRDLLGYVTHAHYRKGLSRLNVAEPDVNEIFIGHTQTRTCEPFHACNLWNLDTGAGRNGKLTIMDVNTKEYWQSDNVLDLYPGTEGRLKMK